MIWNEVSLMHGFSTKPLHRLYGKDLIQACSKITLSQLFGNVLLGNLLFCETKKRSESVPNEGTTRDVTSRLSSYLAHQESSMRLSKA